MNNLPVFKMVLGENGIEYVALVDDPAIKELWIAMNEHKPTTPIKIEMVNEEKRIIMSPMLIANQLIYRKMEGKEFYVYFDANTIEATVQKLMKDKVTDQVNEMHKKSKIVDGVYMYQVYLVNRELGIMPPKAYKDLEDGSAIVFYKIESDEVWERVKSGEFKGISIEGNFNAEPADLTEGEVITVAQSLLKDL